MQTDPFEARRTGAHRLRVITASLGAAAVVGTGGLAWSIASDTSAAAEQSSTDGSTTSSGDSFSPSSTLPQSSSSGSADASSGGS
jgi:hypothetical protein